MGAKPLPLYNSIMPEKNPARLGNDLMTKAGWLWLATAVLLLAAVLRLIFLSDVPPGLAQDEVLNADVVTFIRQGAHSLFFREGYGHEPLYHYWSVPFQVLIGDNVLSIRLPAVFLGMFLVALTMRWAKRSFDTPVAVASGLFLAISWWPIIFSRVGIRPIMEPVLLLLFAWFWPRRPWLAGLFLGLSLYTYTGARVIFLMPALLAIYWFFQRGKESVSRVIILGRSWPQPLVAAIISLVVALVIYLPLALKLRADPTLQQRVQQLEGPLGALSEGNLSPILRTSLATLGVFSFTGDPRWTYMLPGRPLFDPLTAVLFYAGVALALWRLKRPDYAFVLTWLAVGLLPSAITPQAPSTIRMIGALPAVYIFPALIVAWLWAKWRAPGNAAAWLRYAIPIVLAGVFLLNLAITISNGFVRWPQALETRLKYQSVLVDTAAYLKEQPAGDPVFADGFYRPITADSLRRDLGWDPGGRWVQTGEEVSGALVIPAGGGGTLFVPEYAAPNPQLMALSGITGKPLYRSTNTPSFSVYDLHAGHAVPKLAQPVNFDQLLSLVGYEITTPEDGQAIQIVTAWQVIGPLPDDLAIFVHWLDGEGNLISQHDGLDAAPGTLRPGDIIIQRHVLPWTSSLPAPIGSLHLGLYLRETGQRLQIFDEAGATADFYPISLEENSLGE